MRKRAFAAILFLVFTAYTGLAAGQPIAPIFSASGDISATGVIWAGDGFKTGGTFGGTTYGDGIGGVSSITFKDGTTQLTAATSGSSGCTAISYLPYTISNGGVYCLTENLTTEATSGKAISVEADNVVVDLGGWTLACSSCGWGPTTTAIGGTNITNVTIRNGSIVKFHEAIHIQGASNQQLMIENIRAMGNQIAGIWIEGGSYNIVRGNQLMDIHGKAINLTGEGTHCIDNHIQWIGYSLGPFEAIGISLSAAPHSIVEGNRISSLNNCIPDCTVYGVKLSNSPYSVIEGNRITTPIYQSQLGPMRCESGIKAENSNGVLAVGNRIIGCSTGIMLSGTSSKYRDNMTINALSPYIGGFNAGNNQ